METTRSAALLRMARSISARRAEGAEEGAEGGFTLIELMVVLLIMAILLAIAIPTFLGVKGGAQNRAVQSDLTNAITSAKAIYTNVGTYGANATTLAQTIGSSEPELNFVAGAVNTSVAHQVSVAVSADGQVLVLAGQSGNGTCWYAEDNEEPAGLTSAQFNTATGWTNGAAGQVTLSNGISYNSSPVAANCTAGTTAGGTIHTWSASYPSS